MTFVASELGGSAGAVVASRLSDIPEWKVLLLEAGPDEPPGADVPSMVAMFLGKFQLNLSYTPQSAALFRYTILQIQALVRYNEHLKCIECTYRFSLKVSFDSYLVDRRYWKKYFRSLLFLILCSINFESTFIRFLYNYL